jgi:SAM-dependent methyltransferase
VPEREPTGGVSRRALFGLGLTRALDELPEAVRPKRREPPRAPIGSAFDGQLAPVADALVAATGAQEWMTVLELSSEWIDLEPAIAERGAVVEPAAAGDRLPFDDASVDVVVGAFGLAFAGPPDLVLPDLFRVLQPGGIVTIAAWTGSGFMGAALEAVSEVAPGAAQATVWGRTGTMQEQLTLHARDVHLERRFVELTFPTAGLAWTAFTRLPPPIGPAIAALSEPERERLEESFTDLLPHQRMAGPVSVTAHYQLVAARAA